MAKVYNLMKGLIIADYIKERKLIHKAEIKDVICVNDY